MTDNRSGEYGRLALHTRFDLSIVIGHSDITKLTTDQRSGREALAIDGVLTDKMIRVSHPSQQTTMSSTAVAIANSFQGLSFGQLNTHDPPDVPVAAGPEYVMQMVNDQGRIFQKQGSLVSSFALATFFGTGQNFISDPRVLFDNSSYRWFASLFSVNDISHITNGNVSIAVSSSDNPNDYWSLYNIPTGTIQPDQPMIGLSSDKLVVSVNQFATNTGPFQGAKYWVLNKGEMIDGSAAVDYWTPGVMTGFDQVFPVMSQTPTSIQYMVSTSAEDVTNATATAQVFAISGVPPGTVTPAVSYLTIQGVSRPPTALQPGANSVDTRDMRVQDAVYFGGKIWFALNTACKPSGDTLIRACIRLTEIDASSNTLLQDFNFSSKGFYYYYPAIRVDQRGDLDMIFGFSSQSNSTCCFSSLAISGQAVGDPSASLASPRVFRLATGSYATNRYGDYFGAGLDPSDPSLVWVAGQYSTIGGWATEVGAITMIGYVTTASPASATLAAGVQNEFILTATSLNGFSGTLSLDSSVYPTGPTTTLGSQTLSLASGGTSSTTFTFSSTMSGSFTVTLSTNAGTLARMIMVTVSVYDFSISASPTVISIPRGSSATSTITLSSLNGFSGTVNLSTSSSPTGPSLGINPTSVTFPGGSGTSTLTITTTQSTATGSYFVGVTGTGSGIAHTSTIAIVVTPFSFNFQTSATFTGVTVVGSGNLSVDPAATMNQVTFSGTVSLTATNSTTGQLLVSKSYMLVKYPFGASLAATFILNTPLPLPLGLKIALALTGGSTSSVSNDLKRNWDINLNGVVDSADLSAVQASFGCHNGDPCYNSHRDLNADGVVDIVDLALVSSSYGTIDFIPNFNVTAPNLTRPVGSTGSVAVTLVSANGFSGPVSLFLAVPNGVSASLSSSTLTLVVDGTNSVTLTASSTSATPAGNYQINVTATAGVIVHKVTVVFSVSDFSVSIDKQSLELRTGVSGTATLTIRSQFGFAGTVSLSASSAPSGPTLTLIPTSVTLTAGSSSTSTLTVKSNINGNFAITVTTTSGAVSHTLVINVNVCSSLPCGNVAYTRAPTSMTFQGYDQAKVNLWDETLACDICAQSLARMN